MLINALKRVLSCCAERSIRDKESRAGSCARDKKLARIRVVNRMSRANTRERWGWILYRNVIRWNGSTSFGNQKFV